MLFMEPIGKEFTEIDPNVDIQSSSFDDVLEISRDLSNGMRFACSLVDNPPINSSVNTINVLIIGIGLISSSYMMVG